MWTSNCRIRSEGRRSRAGRGYRLAYNNQAKSNYLIGGQSSQHDYWLTAYEEDPPNPPCHDAELSMGEWFAGLVAPETGRAETDFHLGLYMRFGQPRYDRPGGWRDWIALPTVLELPSAGLARAIRTAKACTAELPR